MKILVTGSEGQLGHALKKRNDYTSNDLFSFDFNNGDVTDIQTLKKAVLENKPDIIIHCAAYTSVDNAEIEPETCRKINIEGTKNIIEICKEMNSGLVFISTDYVFNGKGNLPYETDEKVDPINEYGRSKAIGENLIRENLTKYFIVRTSWMFGEGDNFVQKILKLSKECESISVVCDQIGSPTFSEDLADTIFQLIETQYYGTYHITNEGFCSFADWAEEIVSLSIQNVKIKQISSSEFDSLAKRPQNSRLSKRCLDEVHLERLPLWQDGLMRYLRSILS